MAKMSLSGVHGATLAAVFRQVRGAGVTGVRITRESTAVRRWIILLAAFPWLVPPVQGQWPVRYGLGYELTLAIDKEEYSIRSTSQLREGEEIAHDFGRYRLELLLERVVGEALHCSVKVTDLKSDVSVEGGILSNTFEIYLDSVSEVEVLSGQVAFRAAISAAEIHGQ